MQSLIAARLPSDYSLQKPSLHLASLSVSVLVSCHRISACRQGTLTALWPPLLLSPGLLCWISACLSSLLLAASLHALLTNYSTISMQVLLQSSLSGLFQIMNWRTVSLLARQTLTLVPLGKSELSADPLSHCPPAFSMSPWTLADSPIIYFVDCGSRQISHNRWCTHSLIIISKSGSIL